MPSIYLIFIPGFPILKLGFWRASDESLWCRYRTPYGKDIIITLWDCESIQEEYTTHKVLAPYSSQSSDELYKVEYIPQCLDYLNSTFGEGRKFDISECRKQVAKDRHTYKKDKVYDLKALQTASYQPILLAQRSLTMSEFIHELKLPFEIFRMEEYWDSWRHPSKFIVVDECMLDRFGYEGAHKTQRQHALKMLRSNFRADIDYIYKDTFPDDLLIGPDRQSKRSNILAVNYPCFLQWSMMIRTDQGQEIRHQCVAQYFLFRLYVEYQIELLTQKDGRIKTQDKLVETGLE